MQYIRVIDLETTGTDPERDAIIELGWTDLMLPDDDAPFVRRGDGLLINPGHPIPPVASAVHHLVDEDVADGPIWDPAFLHLDLPENAQLIARAAHSASFEAGFLEGITGVPWICTYKAALRLWPDAPSHSNQALRYWRKPEGLDWQTANCAHRAFPDAYVTAHLLRELLLDAGGDAEALMHWTQQPALQIKCRIGDYRNDRWDTVPSSFMHWILSKDFDEDTRFTCEHHLALRRAAEQARAEAAPDGEKTGEAV